MSKLHKNTLGTLFSKIPVIDNNNPFNIYWNGFIVLFILASTIVLSYRIAFDLPLTDIVYWIIVLVYFLDILFSFNSDIRVKFEILHHRKDIARYYYSHGLKTDFTAAFPFAYFAILLIPNPEKFEFLWYVLKFFQLLPLLKLLKIHTAFSEISESLNFNPNVMRLIGLAFWFIIGINTIALGWCFIKASEQERSFFDQYLRAIYWGVTTIATIGYGDYSPDKNSNLQIVYTIIVEIIGVGIFGYIIGNISSLIANLDMARAKFRKHLEEINIYMQTQHIPFQMQQRVSNYYHYLWETKKGVESGTLLEDMPKSLKIDILLQINKDIIEKVSLFQNTNDIFIREVVQLLRSEVFLPNDYVIRQGEYGDCMYFLSSGEVEILVDDKRVAVLGSGSPFGETALLQNEKRMASVRALSYCDLYKLSKDDFDSLRRMYPDFDEQVKEVVRKRMEDTRKKTSQ